jgi:hypothetical protein
MALSQRDKEALASGIGTVRIEREDGGYVTDGNRAKLERKDRTGAPPTSPSEVEIVIRDEVGNEKRAVPFDAVIERRTGEGPVDVLVVTGEVESDPGQTVETRGAKLQTVSLIDQVQQRIEASYPQLHVRRGPGRPIWIEQLGEIDARTYEAEGKPTGRLVAISFARPDHTERIRFDPDSPKSIGEAVDALVTYLQDSSASR